MAQVKTESKEICLALRLQLCEPMNLLEEKERMLLGHTSVLVMTSGSARKASASKTLFPALFGPWIDWPTMLLLKVKICMYIKSLDHRHKRKPEG